MDFIPTLALRRRSEDQGEGPRVGALFPILRLEPETLSISSARELLKQCKDKFTLPSNFNFDEFSEVANGFFQAEGHVSCRIKGKYFLPVFAINQNFSAKSLEFFLTLWHVLGRTGSLSLIKNKQGKIVIRLSSESWDTILNNYSKYFYSIYGEKYIAFKKLSDIRRLTHNYKNIDPSSLATATHILYDLSADGVGRKYSLSEQLKLFGVSCTDVKVPIYTDNNLNLSILFIIGFILGDGTLHLRLRNSDKGSIWLIPTLLLPQLKNKYNGHFFSKLENFFTSIEIKTYTINKIKNSEIADILNLDADKDDVRAAGAEITILTIDSIHSIFDKLLPIFKPYSYYFYWKYDQYELMNKVARLVKAKAHYTLYGFTTILDIIYSYPNKRIKSKEFWLDIIKAWFKNRANKNKSSENNIQAVYGRGMFNPNLPSLVPAPSQSLLTPALTDGGSADLSCERTGGERIIAWKCVFPVESKLKSRQFGFNNDNKSGEALKQAILYRDLNVKSWVNSLK